MLLSNADEEAVAFRRELESIHETRDGDRRQQLDLLSIRLPETDKSVRRAW